MPKRNELSLEKRVQIQLLYEQEKSQVEISKTVKRWLRSVQYAIERFATTGSHQNRARTGRITADRQDGRLLNESLKNRKMTSLELAAELSLEINRPAFARTTHRRLHAAVLKAVKQEKSHDSPIPTRKLGTSGP